MSRVGNVRWYYGRYQVCTRDDAMGTEWVQVEPAWLDWSCIPSAWVKRKPTARP